MTKNKLLTLILGISLLAYLVKTIGINEIITNISIIGWKTPLILIPFLIINYVDTWGWIYAFEPPFKKNLISFNLLYWLRICGEAINNFTPTAHLGGEVARIMYLKRSGFTAIDSSLSIIIDKITLIISEIFFIFSGILLLLIHFTSSTKMQFIMCLCLLLGTLIIFVLVISLKNRFLSQFSHWISKKLKWNLVQNIHDKLQELDNKLSFFISNHRKEFILANFFHYIGWVLGTLETWLILYLMNHPVTIIQAFMIESLFGLFKGMGFFIVGSIGILEGGSVLMFQLFGLGSVLGLTFAFFKRIRELFFALISWPIYLFFFSQHKPNNN